MNETQEKSLCFELLNLVEKIPEEYWFFGGATCFFHNVIKRFEKTSKKNLLKILSLFQDNRFKEREKMLESMRKFFSEDCEKERFLTQLINYFSWNKPIASLKGVGSFLSREFEKLKINTVEDLIFHFPHRYLDRRKVLAIREVKVGEEVTVVGTVKETGKKQVKKNLSLIYVTLFDETGYITGVWFNQDYLVNILKEGVKVALSGKVAFRYGRLQMENPFFDILDEEEVRGLNTGRIVPIHRATAKLSPARLRRLVREVLSYADVFEVLPADILSKYKFFSRKRSLLAMHFPETEGELKRARERLAYEELFFLELGLALKKRRAKRKKKWQKYVVEGNLLRSFFSSLPFELTEEQKKVVKEVVEDLKSPYPMNRLLQGEVGSGKTIVAVVAMLIACQSGYQATLMAPTEVLAWQHYEKVRNYLGDLPVKVVILTGSISNKEKDEIRKEIKEGEVDIVIGTHSLVREEVSFKSLALAVIDEQHRFGVWQRVKLREKGMSTDVLVMTATPIPRTLSLTLYGDLDVSAIKSLPPGRSRENTVTVVLDKKHRNWAYKKIREEVKKGHQAYVICPLIEESDKLRVRAVIQEAKRLKESVFPDLRVEILHGKRKHQEKEEVMKKFALGKLDILISTTVVEVGIDVSNATVMLIEDADRFGLSQLHQLRGRIGRGKFKSYCILFGDPTTDEGRKRLEVFSKISDGFKLAEEDLKIRGEGEIFGTRQSGLTDLRIAELTRDFPVLLKARKDAFDFVEKNSDLSSPDTYFIFIELKRRFEKDLDWLSYG